MKKKISISSDREKAEARLINAQATSTLLGGWLPYFRRTTLMIALLFIAFEVSLQDIKSYSVLAEISEIVSKIMR